MHKLLRKAILDCPARALAWSPDGKLLLAGLGGSSLGTRQKKDGAVSPMIFILIWVGVSPVCI
jgi:hypothetical protein